MNRLPDWQLRLEAFARERRTMPFAWGRNDCAIFAADAVEALTGARLLPELRGHLDARGAMRAMQRLGGLRCIAAQALGGEILRKFARVGDVVLVQAGRREALSICNGNSVIGPGAAGMVSVSIRQAIAVWRVG